MASEKRFNVAVTRAQSLLVVVGSARLLGRDLVWRQLLEHVARRGGWRGQRPDWLEGCPAEEDDHQ